MEVIGVPFDLGGRSRGSRLGPAALRLAGLVPTLEALRSPVLDAGDLNVDLLERSVDGGLKNFEPAHHLYRSLFDQVTRTLQAGRRPIVLGGDHSLAIGSVGAALTHFQGDLAVLWVDAHADLNTPATSPSRNLHGMPLGCLLGTPSGTTGASDIQWQTLQKEFARFPLLPTRTAWLGLRDLDAGEQARLRELPHEYVATMYDIDRKGMVHEVERFDAWMRNSGAKRLWVSFDVDSLDPFLAPGTGTAVRGGLTYREAQLLAEMLHEFLSDGAYELAGVDLVEVNPLIDMQNQTAVVGVEWIASLFGKTILGGA